MRFSPHADTNYMNYFLIAEERFKALLWERDRFFEMVEKGLNFMHAPCAAEKLDLLKAGYFSEELFQAMICAGKSYNTASIVYMWRRLVGRRLVIPTLGHFPGAFVDHVFNKSLLSEYISAKTFLNIFAPPSELVNRYKNAIVAIDVRVKSGDLSRGTGFVAIGDRQKTPCIYTCKHNVDPEAKIEVLNISTAGGKDVSFDKPHCHPREDIAIIPLLIESEDEPVFRFRHDVEMFDEVFTLGFPKVPLSRAHVVGHRGEINGFPTSYSGEDKFILISNLVSPGSSGCPVIDRDGFCVGMSIQWLEGTWGEESARFSAALPASLLASAL